MSQPDKTAQDREILQDAQQKGTLATLGAYVRLSGPGWLQSAITLGGGSLASSLYLGILTGFAMLWLQPLAMVLGIVMLSAIGYVTMSTEQRPFQAINQHVNPVLGWSWALASLAANMVWCLPQYSLATGVLTQNLLPDDFLKVSIGSMSPDMGQKVILTAIILVITTLITWSYDSGRAGIKIYEILLKVMVGVIVLSFGAVVVSLSMNSGLSWGEIWAGFVPNLSHIWEPTEEFQMMLNELSGSAKEFWSSLIVGEQRNRMISAAATAVGINMTFLFPYSLLKKGWTKEFRGLCTFDLFTGMLIPFTLATSCVIIAASARFHAQPTPGFLGEKDAQGQLIKPEPRLQKDFDKFMTSRLEHELGAVAFKKLRKDKDKVQEQIEAMSDAEKRVAASLLNQDAFGLAKALEPISEGSFAKLIFGIGVLGMTLSTISLLMLISGFVVCEIFGVEPKGWPFRLGTLFAATGVLGPFVWSGASFYLAVPTSVFGMSLLPIAYLTFFLLMNQKRLLGDEMPRGGKRVILNVMMAIAATVALLASTYVIMSKAGFYGVLGVVGLLFLAIAFPAKGTRE